VTENQNPQKKDKHTELLILGRCVRLLFLFADPELLSPLEFPEIGSFFCSDEATP
jgi:hypothetical protein